MNVKTLLLVASFGTTYKETRKKTIDAVVELVKESFPEITVQSCFTSRKVLQRIEAQEGINMEHFEEALQRAVRDGFTDIAVLPTHLMDGIEYTRMQEILKKYQTGSVHITLGKPLLSSDEDLDAVIREIVHEIPCEGIDAAVLMGHGTEVEANQVYEKVQTMLHKMGRKEIYVGTVEGTPTIESLLPLLKKETYKSILLLPFMLVAGDHACNDMAGEKEDSWKSILEREGYQVSTILKGLGEYSGIQRLYIEHAKLLVRQFSK